MVGLESHAVLQSCFAMKPREFMPGHTPLSQQQKLNVLKRIQNKIVNAEAQEALCDYLQDAIQKRNAQGFPSKLADFITQLGGPYSIMTGKDIETYDGLVEKQIQQIGLRLFTESAKSKNWGSERLLEIAGLFGIALQPAPLVKVAIIEGKLYWKIYQGDEILAETKSEPPIDEDEIHYITMTPADFCLVKNAGKRSGNELVVEYNDDDGESTEIDLSRPDRNPVHETGRHEGLLDHSDVDLCHVCAWDVGEYHELNLHKKSGHLTQQLDCNRHNHNEPTLKLKYDHIPSDKHLNLVMDTKISKTKEIIENLCDEIIDLEENEVELIHYPEETEEKIDDAKETLARAEARLTRFERSKASVNERGYCMAIPTLWNDRSRTEKSKNITNVDHNEETAAPDKAVRRDIKNYVTVLKRDYQETPNASLLQIFGAFRNLYRKNVKRNNDYASQKTDRFFMRELQEQLDIRDGSKTAEVTSPMGHNKG